MAGLVVVDTDLVIDFLRGKGPGVALIRELIADRRIALTAVTAFELRLGTDFLDRQPDIMRLLRSRTLPLDSAGGLAAGAVATVLRRTGREIGMADCLQAGVCLRFDLPMATRNVRHFSRIDGLRLIDPEFGK